MNPCPYGIKNGDSTDEIESYYMCQLQAEHLEPHKPPLPSIGQRQIVTEGDWIHMEEFFK